MEILKILYVLLILFIVSCRPHIPISRPLNLECSDVSLEVDKAFATSSFCPGQWPSDEWWLLFHDSQLTELIGRSLCCHPDMKVAEFRIELAYAYAMDAKSRFLPHFYLLGDMAKSKASRLGTAQSVIAPNAVGPFTAPTFTFNAFLEVDIWRRNRALYQAALDETFAAVAERSMAKLLLSLAVAQSYYNFQFHRLQLGIIKDRVEKKRQLLALLQESFVNKILSEFQLYQTDSELAVLQDIVVQLEAVVQVDVHQLQALVGNSCCDPLQLEALMPHAEMNEPFPLPVTLPFDLLARRPDVIAKRWFIEADSCRVWAAQAKFFPSLDLLAYIGFQSNNLAEFITNNALIYLGEAVGLLPLYMGGKLSAELSQAQMSLEIAIQEYNQTVLTAIKEVENSMTELMAQDERKKMMIRQFKDAENLFRLTNSEFISGTKNRLALLNAEEDLLFHKDLLVTIDLSRFEAILSLIWSIGGGYYVP